MYPIQIHLLISCCLIYFLKLVHWVIAGNWAPAPFSIGQSPHSQTMSSKISEIDFCDRSDRDRKQKSLHRCEEIYAKLKRSCRIVWVSHKNDGSRKKICDRIYVHPSIHTYIHPSIHTYIRTYVRMYVCMDGCMYVCMDGCTYMRSHIFFLDPSFLCETQTIRHDRFNFAYISSHLWRLFCFLSLSERSQKSISDIFELIVWLWGLWPIENGAGAQFPAITQWTNFKK